MERSLINLVLRIPSSILQEIQDECDEFNFGLDEFVSLIVAAAVVGKIESGTKGCIYERIDWAFLKEKGICE